MKKLDNYLEKRDNEFLIVENIFKVIISSKNKDFTGI